LVSIVLDTSQQHVLFKTKGFGGLLLELGMMQDARKDVFIPDRARAGFSLMALPELKVLGIGIPQIDGRHYVEVNHSIRTGHNVLVDLGLDRYCHNPKTYAGIIL